MLMLSKEQPRTRKSQNKRNHTNKHKSTTQGTNNTQQHTTHKSANVKPVTCFCVQRKTTKHQMSNKHKLINQQTKEQTKHILTTHTTTNWLNR